MHVSVVICTRNRAASLARTLVSIEKARLPPALSWELLVVDNGSSDETASVIASFKPRLPVRRVVESVRGLSRARNAGVAAASGDYIAWTDDDVEVGTEWFTTYVEAFQAYPEAAVFGGTVTPVLAPPVPDWFLANRDWLGNYLAERDFGDPDRPLDPASGMIPFGANFVVRAGEQRQFLYDPALGAGSGSAEVGEETRVVNAILASGKSGVWIPRAAVRHHIPHTRLKAADIGRWFKAVGYVAQLEAPSAGPFMFGVPRWIWRDVATRGLRYRAARLRHPIQVWIRDWANYAEAQGRMAFWLANRQRTRTVA